MIKQEFLNVKTVMMNTVPIYQILDEIEAKGGMATYHSCITDEIISFSSTLLRNYILKASSIMFDEGDTITDGVGYTVLKNGEWSDYKKLPVVDHCKFCQLYLSEK